MIIQFDDFLGGILQIVVHRDHKVAARMAQAGHDGVVLAIIPGVLDINQRDLRCGQQVPADLGGVIGAAIIDQHDLQPALGLKF